jgi:hypothetical protein
LQLSSNRITVQDLVPYFQDGSSYEDIIRLIPALTRAEIAVVEQYYRQHREELDEQELILRERIAQRTNSPEMEQVLKRGGEKMAALRKEFGKKRQQERNGDNASG